MVGFSLKFHAEVEHGVSTILGMTGSWKLKALSGSTGRHLDAPLRHRASLLLDFRSITRGSSEVCLTRGSSGEITIRTNGEDSVYVLREFGTRPDTQARRA